jgi:hypothetical protein
MPRRPCRRQLPSVRNLRIYHDLAYRRLTQVEVAAAYGLTQCRISQIARRVRDWVAAAVPPRGAARQEGIRLHQAIACERLKLRAVCDPLARVLFAGARDQSFIRRGVARVDGQPVTTLEITGMPDFKLWYQLLAAQSRLGELDSLAALGPFYELPDTECST